MESSAFLSFDVTPREDGMQLSSVLRSRFGISRGMIRRLKQNDCAKVDGVVVPMRHRLRDGERVTLHLPPTLESNVEPEDVPLDIRYEDAHLLIVEKPAGMLVHPAGFEQLGTLANGVVFHLLSKGEPPVAGPVTRLDRGTSGLVLFAKHPHVHHRLTQDLRRDLVEREYIAIVHGKLADDRGTIDAPIRRIGPATSERCVAADGQHAITHYRVLERFESQREWERQVDRGATLVELSLETGRTHQIRVHMAYRGHPLLGDSLYGRAEEELISRPALHARRLSLVHPIDGHRLDLTSQPPADFQRLLKRLRRVDADSEIDPGAEPVARIDPEPGDPLA